MIEHIVIAKDIVPVYQLVDREEIIMKGSEIYCFLQGTQDWIAWLNERILENGFHVKKDYIVTPCASKDNDRIHYEYWLKLGMVKELARQVNNPYGRLLRSYIIQFEAKQEKEKTTEMIFLDKEHSRLEKLLGLLQTAQRDKLFSPEAEQAISKQVSDILLRSNYYRSYS